MPPGAESGPRSRSRRWTAPPSRCFYSYGILSPIHPLTFALGAFSVTAVNMITHCGYRLPVYDWYFVTAREHDVHHASREPRSISVMLAICDRMFGTFQRAR